MKYDTLIFTIAILSLLTVFHTVTYHYVFKLLNGQVTGVFTGFLGNYILRTFSRDGLFTRGAGLPVTLTKATYSNVSSGTLVFLSIPNSAEQERCKGKTEVLLNPTGYWWTTVILRNKGNMSYRRFDKYANEFLVVPFWCVIPPYTVFMITVVLVTIVAITTTTGAL